MDKIITKFVRMEYCSTVELYALHRFLKRLTQWQREVLFDFYVLGKERTFQKYGIDYDFLINLGVLENELY